MTYVNLPKFGSHLWLLSWARAEWNLLSSDRKIQNTFSWRHDKAVKKNWHSCEGSEAGVSVSRALIRRTTANGTNFYVAEEKNQNTSEDTEKMRPMCPCTPPKRLALCMHHNNFSIKSTAWFTQKDWGEQTLIHLAFLLLLFMSLLSMNAVRAVCFLIQLVYIKHW